MEEAMKAAADTDAKEAFVIGGGEIFKQVLPQANRVYLTRVHATLEGDTFFPELPAKEWKLLSQLDITAANSKGHGIHSPFVYDFVRNVLNDHQQYPAYKRVEAMRELLLKDKTG